MQTIQLLFVGIFWFSAEVFHGGLNVMAPLTASVMPSVSTVKSYAILTNNYSSLKPILNNYKEGNNNNYYGPAQNSKPDLKGRNQLTASVQKSLPPTFSPTNWSKISQRDGTNLSHMASIDLASTFTYNDDMVQQFSADLINVYDNLVILLLHKMQTWMDSKQGLDTIECYLGFDPYTKNLIDIAMTEILTEKRIVQYARTDDLESLFYYSCDLKHMDTNEEAVKEKFRYFINKFVGSRETVLKNSEEELRNGLRQNLKKIVDKTNPSFGVSIRSMKMRTLLESTKNEIFNAINKRIIDPDTNQTVQNLVKSYANEIDGEKVNDYHVSILSVLIPDIFGYVQNHFELLAKLKEYDINKDDQVIINLFSGFMRPFMSIFVDRFFEFKGKYSQEFVDAMFSIMDFLDVRELTEDQKSVKHDLDFVQYFEPRKSILNYYNKSERNDIVNDHMKKLMNKAVSTLLETCNGELPDHWETNRWSKIDYKNKTSSKEKLVESVYTNMSNAFEVLDIFAGEFTLNTVQYEEYDLGKFL